MSALMIAVEYEHADIVSALLKVDGIDVNAVNRHGMSAFAYSVQNTNVEIVNALLDALLDAVDLNDINLGNTPPLIVATYNSNVEVVNTLLKIKGIDINVSNNDGYTAFTVPVWGNHEKIDYIRNLLTLSDNVNNANLLTLLEDNYILPPFPSNVIRLARNRSWKKYMNEESVIKSKELYTLAKNMFHYEIGLNEFCLSEDHNSSYNNTVILHARYATFSLKKIS